MRMLFALLITGTTLVAQETTATRAEGLAAWERIYAVASHPRCTNCHVGPQQTPMWEGLAYAPDTQHGMNVLADDSRVGAESVPCRTCHVKSARANDVSHAPPHIDEAWRLPPVELDWLDQTSTELCVRLRDPETNGDNTMAELADHLRSSAFVNWGFTPGGGRSMPAGSAEDMALDIAVWGAAGTPCLID